MASVPVPTFVPQDAWYKLTSGNLNPNIADSVPVGADLLPSTDPNNQQQDGIVGSLDGAVIYLAGFATQLDGGQGWFMWVAASLKVSDGKTVFCPFVDATKPGRWIATGTPNVGPGLLITTQTFTAGASHNIVSLGGAQICYVFVKGRSANLATTLNLPGTVTIGQQFIIKDAQGDAGTYAININGPIDGGTADALVNNYAERSYVWNGTEFSAG